MVFGDSLVQGVGATSGNDFVSVISRKLGVEILNRGVSGNTTRDGLERLQSVIDEDPGTVIILLGGNDYLRRISKTETFENLRKIVHAFKSNGTIVILLGVRGGLLKDTYRNEFDAFAKQNKLIYIPNVLDGLIGNDELMSDQIHPNDRGYEIIAQKIAPVLKRIISK